MTASLFYLLYGIKMETNMFFNRETIDIQAILHLDPEVHLLSHKVVHHFLIRNSSLRQIGQNVSEGIQLKN